MTCSHGRFTMKGCPEQGHSDTKTKLPGYSISGRSLQSDAELMARSSAMEYDTWRDKTRPQRHERRLPDQHLTDAAEARVCEASVSRKPDRIPQLTMCELFPCKPPYNGLGWERIRASHAYIDRGLSSTSCWKSLVDIRTRY